MAGVLIRMKLRVLSHSLQGKRAVLFTVSAIYALGAAVISALLPLIAGSDLDAGTDVAAALFAVWMFGWVVAPIVTGGGDETLRPENFALLPVTSRGLARGLLAASFVGVPAAATLVGFFGVVVVGAHAGVGPALIGVIGLLLELAFVIVLSRVLIAGLGAVLTSRRGRDLGVLLASLAALAYIPMRVVFEAVGPVLIHHQDSTLSAVVRALPSGWAAVAVRATARGDLVLSVVPLAGLVVIIALLLAAWAPLLQRRLTLAPTSTGPSARSARVRPGHQTRSLGPVATVVGRELKLWWRDARRRSLLLTSVLLGVAIPAFSFAGGTRSVVPFTAVWLVAFAAMQVGNLYGLDGGSLWHVLVTPGAARADVRGRQAAWLAIVAPAAVAAAVIAPLAAGSTSAYRWLAGLVPVLLGSAAGVIVMQSVYVPFAMPQQRNQNPFAGNMSGSSPGCVRIVAGLGYLLLLVPAASPVVAIVVAGDVAHLAWLSWLAGPVGVAEGVTLAWWWGRIAYRRLDARGPEILAEVRIRA